MKASFDLSRGIALVWAGVAIGGSLIATPAKFQAPTLSMTTALEVGRAQFFWVGIGEWILCAAFVGALVLCRRIDWRIASVPVLIFLAQRLLLMPELDARTVQVIAGQDVGQSYLHLIYIGAEILKVGALLAATFLMARSDPSSTRP